MRINLRRLPPTHPLHPYVRSVFRLCARDAYAAETMLPRGNVNILFNLGPAIHVAPTEPAAARIEWKTTIVCGLQTRPLVSRPDRDVYILGVNLRPETCFTFLRTPLGALTNACVDGSLLWQEADVLLNQLGETQAFDAQCELLFAWLARAAALDEPATLVSAACRLLGLGTTAGAVGRTASRIGLSHRHLQRLFGERVGVSPARYAQLARFARALPLISSTRTLTDVAARTGYFDQAHFCRDFRAFAGMSPDAYRQAGALVPGHIFST